MRRALPAGRLRGAGSSADGLGSAEVGERRAEYGPNAILDVPARAWHTIARETLRDPMLWFLAGVGALYALVGQRTESLTLLAAIAPLVLMDLVLHRRTSASTAGLQGRLAARALAIRDGTRVEIPALDLVPDHAPSLAGLGRLAVGAGKLDDAIGQFEHASAVVPLPEYVVALGDAQAAAGRTADAAKSYDLARAEIQLFKAAGVVVDVDLALLEADHGDPAAALRYANAAYSVTPTVRAADAVAWAMHRLGRDRDALRYVSKALRLGSIDPILRYHAGAIEAAADDPKAARRDLELALATDPGFSATGAAEARRLLGELPA